MLENKHGEAAEITRHKILRLELDEIVKKANHEFKSTDQLFGTEYEYVDQAKAEFRHFLYLLWWNRKAANLLPVVPTKRADIIWHGFLLFNGAYNEFCMDLYGEVIEHNPGLEEGSAPFNEAVIHTKSLHDAIGDGGFDEHYFDYVDTEDPSTLNAKRASTCGGGSAGFSPGDSGSSCGAGCGGGGGGCGG
ncbi:hypothetical protein [Glaciecola petra]|uniref:Glycine-rich domain-containing protein-like n=1 Tax=Glaciecola petra TaxID=3075602 RepID=A0ABU2ZTU3_9ALTE|nr:hypothetical protein [Aestuariibacter sp. P117]MDT0596057.1 hypothetical protein [Aestuariibacter sp. P117]